MLKEDFVKLVLTYVKSSDTHNYVMKAKYFLSILEIEQRLDVYVIDLETPEKIASKIKICIVEEIRKILSKHDELYIVLKKKTSLDNVINGLLYDGYVLNNISERKVNLTKKFLGIGNSGLYRSYNDIMVLKTKSLTPFYSRLIPILKSDELSTIKGMFIVKTPFTVKNKK